MSIVTRVNRITEKLGLFQRSRYVPPIVSEAFGAFFFICQQVNARLNVPVVLLQKEQIQLELLEAHLVQGVEFLQLCELFISLLILQFVHLLIVALLDFLLLAEFFFGKLLLGEHFMIFRDLDNLGGCHHLVLFFFIVGIVT